MSLEFLTQAAIFDLGLLADNGDEDSVRGVILSMLASCYRALRFVNYV